MPAHQVGLSCVFVKAKMYAISSDTHQLGPTVDQTAPLYNIIIIYYDTILRPKRNFKLEK